MRRYLLVALLLAGCAGEQQRATSKQSAKEIIKYGVIESVTPVQLDNSSNGGAAAGSIFGQVGGANSGGGRGAVVGSILGNVLGSTLGQQAGVSTKPGLEIWIKLDNENQSAYVMQPGLPTAFKAGDQVRVIRRGAELHVEPLETSSPSKDK